MENTLPQTPDLSSVPTKPIVKKTSTSEASNEKTVVERYQERNRDRWPDWFAVDFFFGIILLPIIFPLGFLICLLAPIIYYLNQYHQERLWQKYCHQKNGDKTETK